jgi:tetratricopeptide (TPR) repeat protein
MAFVRRHMILIFSVAQIAGGIACNESGQVEIARGNALASRNDLDGALRAYEAAAKAAPKRARPHELIGHVFFDQRRFDEAEKAYRDAIAIDPDGALEARIGLARVEAEQGKIDPSIEQLNAILAKRPKNLYALLSRANLLIRRGRPGDTEQAIVDTATAMAIDASNSSVLYTRGNAFLAAGQLDKAEEAFRLLAGAHPNSALSAYGEARLASARKNRGIVLERLREAKKKASAVAGAWHPNEVRTDSAFQWLKDDPEFVSLITAS